MNGSLFNINIVIIFVPFASQHFENMSYYNVNFYLNANANANANGNSFTGGITGFTDGNGNGNGDTWTSYPHNGSYYKSSPPSLGGSPYGSSYGSSSGYYGWSSYP